MEASRCCGANLGDVQAVFHQNLVIVWREAGTERNQRRFLVFGVERRYLVALFTKVEKNKRRSRSREEGRSRKAAECDVPARALESVSHWPLREEPYQAGGIIEVMNEAAQDVCTG